MESLLTLLLLGLSYTFVSSVSFIIAAKRYKVDDSVFKELQTTILKQKQHIARLENARKALQRENTLLTRALDEEYNK